MKTLQFYFVLCLAFNFIATLIIYAKDRKIIPSAHFCLAALGASFAGNVVLSVGIIIYLAFRFVSNAIQYKRII